MHDTGDGGSITDYALTAMAERAKGGSRRMREARGNRRHPWVLAAAIAVSIVLYVVLNREAVLVPLRQLWQALSS